MTISLKQSLAGLAAAIAIAAAFIAPKEGLRLIAYRDIVGVPTICYGETRDVEMGDVKTKAECDAMLQKRVEEFAVTLAPCMPEVLPAKTRAAFISLGYNIGKGAFCRSQTIQGAFKRNDLVGACNGILLFDKAGGKKVRGLTIRRQEENVMCLQGLREGK